MQDEQLRATAVEGVRRIVVKVGTAVISTKAGTLDTAQVRLLAEQVHGLKQRGLEIVLVTSGAIGAGMGELGWCTRPTTLPELQAAAAVGQSRLMVAYDECFKHHGYHAGQILLTRQDFDDRTRYLNVRNTIRALLEACAIPVINENDTVAVDEIRFGENDILSALVNDLVLGDLLIMLTSADGLLDRKGSVVDVVAELSADVLKLDRGTKTGAGVGGMKTKLQAAELATNAGVPVMIANGRERDVLGRLLDGERLGTLILPAKRRMTSRKRWIGFSTRAKGTVVVDDGARTALVDGGKSLLASGISSVRGRFHEGDVVSICDSSDTAFARGLTNYSASDLRQISGRKTSEIEAVLGSCRYEEVVHRDNIVILTPRGDAQQ